MSSVLLCLHCKKDEIQILMNMLFAGYKHSNLWAGPSRPHAGSSDVSSDVPPMETAKAPYSSIHTERTYPKIAQ